MTILGKLSFWYADIGLPETRRPAFQGPSEADVVVIGAGYTGLWTAYYLKQQDPALRVTILEKHFAGYGASGRNGGWLSGGFSWNHERYAETTSVEAVRRMVQAMAGTVDEVIRVAEAEGIDADIRRCDELMVATNPAQMLRLQAETKHRAHWGEGGRVCIGEVSTVNDDRTDNIFEAPIGRFSTIEEDADPLHLLVSDYDAKL